MKLKLIAHRVNTIAQLKKLPENLGVEIDLRSRGSKIILHHDPFCAGEYFDKWLNHYHHGTIILNVKEDGLERPVIKMLSERQITDYFFLDTSFPNLISLSNEGINKLAVRFSEFECLETVLKMEGRVEYVWIDCFTKMPLNRETYGRLKSSGFKICLVSPELQKHSESEIKLYYSVLKEQKIFVDAICTKNPKIWETLYKDNRKQL